MNSLAVNSPVANSQGTKGVRVNDLGSNGPMGVSGQGVTAPGAKSLGAKGLGMNSLVNGLRESGPGANGPGVNGPRANGLRVNSQGGWPWRNRSVGKRPGDDEQCGEWSGGKLHEGKWSRDDWSSLG